MEIEKKFFVKEIPENLEQYDVYQLEQGYLCSYPTVRIRKCDEDYFLTYKSKGTSRKEHKNIIVNNEVELELNENSYETLKTKIDGKLVVKDRYVIPIQDDLVAEMDIFKGHLEGLKMVEVEFDNEDQAISFIPPDSFGVAEASETYFGKDVSDDHRFRNVNLASIDSLEEL